MMLRMLPPLLLLSSSLLAAGGGGHGATLKEHGFYLIDFLLFVSILYVLLKAPLAAAWAARRQGIMEQLERARERVTGARLREESAKGAMEALPQELESMRRAAREESAAEQARLLEAAQAEREKLERQAQEAARAQELRLLAQLQRDLALRSIAIAEETLRRSPPPSGPLLGGLLESLDELRSSGGKEGSHVS